MQKNEATERGGGKALPGHGLLFHAAQLHRYVDGLLGGAEPQAGQLWVAQLHFVLVLNINYLITALSIQRELDNRQKNVWEGNRNKLRILLNVPSKIEKRTVHVQGLRLWGGGGGKANHTCWLKYDWDLLETIQYTELLDFYTLCVTKSGNYNIA